VDTTCTVARPGLAQVVALLTKSALRQLIGRYNNKTPPMHSLLSLDHVHCLSSYVSAFDIVIDETGHLAA
jgi:hypothetical protein